MKGNTMKVNTFRRMIALCVLTLLSAGALVSAATWTGAGGTNNWSTGANWDTNAAPGQYEPVAIGGNAAVNFDSGNAERSADTSLTGQAKLTAANRRFLHGANAPCTFTLADSAQVVQSGDYFIISQRHPCVFNQIGGSLSANINRGFFLTDNAAAAGSLYNLAGGTLNVLFVAQGDDWFNEFLGRAGAAGTFYVNGGQASFSVSNPTTLTRHIYIKNNSVLKVDSGLASFTGFRWFSIGRADAGEAKVIVNGGVLNITSRSDGAVIVGGENAQGRIDITGGALNIASPNGLWVGDGTNCKRAIVMQTGGDVTVDTDVVLGRVTTAIDTYYQMDGGTLTARDILLHANAHSSVKFVFNAGKITLDGDRTGIVNEAWFIAAPGTVVSYDAVNNKTTLSRIPYAHGPAPASGQVNAGTPASAGQVQVTLSWYTGLDTDPNGVPGQPNPAISTHRLYMSNGTASDPNLYFVGEIPAGTPVAAMASYGPMTLNMDRYYKWRVDEVAEPNTISGSVWSFSTPRALPVVLNIGPARELYGAGQTAQVTVTYASTSSAVTAVTWYLNGTAINPALHPNLSIAFSDSQSTLTIFSMSAAYEGLYSCAVTNAGGTSDPSGTAKAELKKLAAWYAFENDLTDLAADNDGTAVGAPAYISGMTGQSISLNGVDDAVSVARSIQDDFSIELWVKTTSTGGPGGWYEGRGLVDGEMPGAVDDFGAVVRGTKFGFGIGNPDTTISSTSDINDNQWHYCVATRDSVSGDMKVYVDGEMQASAAGPIGTKAASTGLSIGSLLNGGNYLAGQMDEVKLYNYPLDEQTIVLAYHAMTGESVCVESHRPEGRFDMNGDCVVNLADFVEFATAWLDCGLYPVCY